MEVGVSNPVPLAMLSERSIIWATPTLIAHHFAVILHRSLRNGRLDALGTAGGESGIVNLFLNYCDSC